MSSKKIITLSARSFDTIIFSACETYRKESCGALTGIVNNDKAIIKAAFAYQEVDRHPSSVTYKNGKQKKVKQIVKNIGKNEILGEFHSHTADQYGEKRSCVPSKTDIQEMKIGNFEIITAIWKKKKSCELKISDGYIFGAFGKFRIKMACYLKTGEKRYIRCHLEVNKKGVVRCQSNI